MHQTDGACRRGSAVRSSSLRLEFGSNNAEKRWDVAAISKAAVCG